MMSVLCAMVPDSLQGGSAAEMFIKGNRQSRWMILVAKDTSSRQHLPAIYLLLLQKAISCAVQSARCDEKRRNHKRLLAHFLHTISQRLQQDTRSCSNQCASSVLITFNPFCEYDRYFRKLSLAHQGLFEGG